MGEGLLVYHAAEMAAEGKSLDEIYITLKNKTSDILLLALVSDLKYLIRGGRLKPIKGFLGTMLKINPILSLTEKGRIEPKESIRGTVKALRRVRELTKEHLAGSKKYAISLIYAQDKNDINDLRELMKDIIEKASFYEEKAITAVLGAQAGPSVQLVCSYKLD